MRKIFLSRFVAMPSNDEGVFMLVHITDASNESGEDVASVIGPVVKEKDSDGVYYVMPEMPISVSETACSTVLIAVHESKVEESDLAWEIFRDVISGKLTSSGIVR